MPREARTMNWLSRFTRRGFLRSLAAGATVLVLGRSAAADARTHAEGVVFHDRNGSGRRESGDPGVPRVRVSNGRDVTVTDENGRWRLPLTGDRTILFVIKPSGWTTPLSQHNLPRFHHIHDPAGSPDLRYAGIAPTGELPDSVDFPLQPQEEPTHFRAIMCGDPQPRNAREVGFLAQSAVPELARADAAFGISLGDIMFDNLDLFEPLNEAFAFAAKPWYNLLGNHDLNFDADDNTHAYDTFTRVYGPSYYAFEYADVHFLILNNIDWRGRDNGYRGYLGERQLEFIRNEMQHVPREKLTVILLHIPLYSGDRGEGSLTGDREALYRIIEDRPNLVSLSAHRHWHGHFFLGEDDGWRGEQPLHHIVMGTLCGSWFRGSPRNDGIPHATMSDGTPRGYVVFDFNGTRYNIDGYKAIGRPAHEQMHIDVPNIVERSALGDTRVHVNVYNGSDRSTVRMRLAPRDTWRDMQQVHEPDPRYARLVEADKDVQPPYHTLPNPRACMHLWAGELPDDLTPGTYLIEIESTDMFGNTHRGSRPLRIT